MSHKILFICKRHHDYDGEFKEPVHSTGLKTSVEFIVAMLNNNDIEAKMVVVHDNNGIDKELAEYRPTVCIIEALWVVPSKFHVLKRLHPNVQFIVRIHSDLPFIAQEGIAIDWLNQYMIMGVIVGCNSKRIYRSLKSALHPSIDHIEYLPNYYPTTNTETPRQSTHHHINIGCFGAIRRLKNQLIQCFAAIKLADDLNKNLVFHINSQRIENSSEPILKNIRAALRDSGHEIAEHKWLPRHEFIELVRKMDLGMQVSFSETFNIVAADFVDNNIPIITSSEVRFVSQIYQSNCTDADSIFRKLWFAYRTRKLGLHGINNILLQNLSDHAERVWIGLFW